MSVPTAEEEGLQPGDLVAVAIWREPDLSGEFQIDERGIVVFPLIGERTVTGVSPDDLRAELIRDYRNYVQNPSIRVTMLRRMSILGEVRNPGIYPVDGTFTVAEAIGLAGGISSAGNQNDIRLVRKGNDAEFLVSLNTVISVSPIRSGDQIHVGQKSWASRNSGAIVASLIAATAIIGAAVLTN